MAVVGVDFGNLGSRVAVAQNRGIDTLSNEVNIEPLLLLSSLAVCFLVFFLFSCFLSSSFPLSLSFSINPLIH